MEKLLVVLGATASGKSDLALFLASQLEGEIISGDSVQVYRHMDIGSAKLPLQERCYKGVAIPHHLIDIINPDEPFTAADFASNAKSLITEINKRGHLPIMAGGTGYYLEGVYGRNLFESLPARDIAFCEELKLKGGEELHSCLRAIDATAAEKIHANDIKRLVRLLDIYYNYGLTPSQVIEQTEKLPPKNYRLFKCGIEFMREELYARIDKRVDLMLEQGLLDEVKGLLSMGYSLKDKALGSIGYKQLIGYLAGKYDYAEAVRLIKRDTRHFAKRQLTWFRRDNEIHWYKTDIFTDMKELYNAVLADVKHFLQ